MNLCKIHGVAYDDPTCPACDIANELAALKSSLASLVARLAPEPTTASLDPVRVETDGNDTDKSHVASGEHDAERANRVLTHAPTRDALLTFIDRKPWFYTCDLKQYLGIPEKSRSPYIAPALRVLGCHETGGGRWTVPQSARTTLKALCGRLPL